LAQENNLDSIFLDSTNFKSSLDLPVIMAMCNSMSTELNRILDAHKIPKAWIKSVLVEFSFNQENQESYHYWRSAILCKIKAKDGNYDYDVIVECCPNQAYVPRIVVRA
jgi:hypothetical protein